jgi:hypothetical protein
MDVDTPVTLRHGPQYPPTGDDDASPIDDDDDNVVCEKCLRGDDAAFLLLCDCCNAGCHTFCATPRLERIPKGDWYCLKCSTLFEGEEPPQNPQYQDYDGAHQHDEGAAEHSRGRGRGRGRGVKRKSSGRLVSAKSKVQAFPQHRLLSVMHGAQTWLPGDAGMPQTGADDGGDDSDSGSDSDSETSPQQRRQSAAKQKKAGEEQRRAGSSRKRGRPSNPTKASRHPAQAAEDAYQRLRDSLRAGCQAWYLDTDEPHPYVPDELQQSPPAAAAEPSSSSSSSSSSPASAS